MLQCLKCLFSEQENQAYSPRPNLAAKEGPNHSGIPFQGKQNITWTTTLVLCL